MATASFPLYPPPLRGGRALPSIRSAPLLVRTQVRGFRHWRAGATNAAAASTTQLGVRPSRDSVVVVAVAATSGPEP